MKIKNLFTLSMVALLLISCSKENDLSGKEPGKSKLTISLKGEKSVSGSATGRASGTPVEDPDGESKINDFIIYVFQANGDQDINPKAVTVSQLSDLTVKDYEITTNAKEIVVLANTASISAMQTSLKAVTTRSQLEAIVGHMFANNTASAASSQTSTNLWMSGIQEITPKEGGNIKATVTLKYVPARLRITSVKIDDSQIKNLSTDLLLNDISILNAGGASKFIPTAAQTSLIPTFAASAAKPFYYSGLDMIAMSNLPTYYAQNNAYTLALTGTPAIINGTSNQNYFYVFENDGVVGHFNALPTIISLKATYQTNQEVYYSYLFKADANGDLGFDNMIIERGKSYDIKMTIKKLGTTDPTIPSIKTTVEITITPLPWITQVIDKVYE